MDSLACPTELLRETSRASYPKCGVAVCEPRSEDLQGRCAGGIISHIRALTPPPEMEATTSREAGLVSAKAASPVSGVGTMAERLRPAASDGIDRNSSQASAATTTARPFPVDATATFMFSVRSASEAKIEALIVSTRCNPLLKEFGVTGTGTPETKSRNRPQYFVVTNDQSCAGVERSEKLGIVTGRSRG